MLPKRRCGPKARNAPFTFARRFNTLDQIFSALDTNLKKSSKIYEKYRVTFDIGYKFKKSFKIYQKYRVTFDIGYKFLKIIENSSKISRNVRRVFKSFNCTRAEKYICVSLRKIFPIYLEAAETRCENNRAVQRLTGDSAYRSPT